MSELRYKVINLIQDDRSMRILKYHCYNVLLQEVLSCTTKEQ